MSSSQLFRKLIPSDFLYNILDQIALKKEKYYVVDINSYKKMLYHNLHTEFCNKLLDYYHVSKQFYVIREFTYNSFTTILRHLCKFNNIMFSSKIRYIESNYNIDYYIYF
jgi:hypothetical protein